MKSHRAFFSFICIIGLIAVWYWGVAFQALYHYVSLDVYVKPDVIEWHVQEKEKGKYFVNTSPTDSSGNTLLAKEHNYLTMYGIKTFDDGDARIIDIQIAV